MTSQEYNRSVVMLVHLIVMNNAGMVARALRQIGYPVKDFLPAAELEAALLQLSMADRAKFFQMMKNIQWNTGHRATNQPEMINGLIKLASEGNASVNNTNWWPSMVTILENSK